MPRQQQKQRGGGSQAPLPLHAPVTATPRGQGSACATGTGSNRGSTGEASGSRCPQRGFPAAGMALSRCQPSLPPPLGSLPHWPHGPATVGLLPGLCHPQAGQEHRSPLPLPPPSSLLLRCWTPRPRLSGGRGEGHTLPHSNLHSEGGGGRGGSLQTGHSPGPDTPSSPETGLSSPQLTSGEKGARGLTRGQSSSPPASASSSRLPPRHRDELCPEEAGTG